jgi:hypothetical protein
MCIRTHGLAICLYTGCGWLPELDGTCVGHSRCAVQGDDGNTAIPLSPGDSG